MLRERSQMSEAVNIPHEFGVRFFRISPIKRYRAKLILMSIPLLFVCVSASAQPGDVAFKILDVSRVRNSGLRITFSLSATSDSTVVLPEVCKEDLCCSLLRIDVTHSGKTHRIEPCRAAIQLDRHILDSTNAVILRQGQAHTTQLTFKERELPVKLRSGSYTFHAEFNLGEFNITSTMSAVYRKNLRSNDFVLKVK